VSKSPQQPPDLTIKAEDIEAHLAERDDFDLELRVFREMHRHGWNPHHGGNYLDPVLGKSRQYDQRGYRGFDLNRHIAMATECKSLTPEYPLVLSRVKRSDIDSFHDLIKLWRPAPGKGPLVDVVSSGPQGPQLYATGDWLGKSSTQIRHANSSAKSKYQTSDSDVYDKWTQALASAAELVDAVKNVSVPDDVGYPTLAFVMPVLVVPDGTLWAVDYEEDGTRGTPHQVEDAVLYVDRTRRFAAPGGPLAYKLTNLNIRTLTSFTRMLQNMDSPTGLMLDPIFPQHFYEADSARGGGPGGGGRGVRTLR
jgi:hypothetical protein